MGKGKTLMERVGYWLVCSLSGAGDGYAIEAQVLRSSFDTYLVRIRITFPLTYLAVKGRHIELILSPATDWDKFPADRLDSQGIIPTRQNSICDPQEGTATYTFDRVMYENGH